MQGKILQDCKLEIIYVEIFLRRCDGECDNNLNKSVFVRISLTSNPYNWRMSYNTAVIDSVLFIFKNVADSVPKRNRPKE